LKLYLAIPIVLVMSLMYTPRAYLLKHSTGDLKAPIILLFQDGVTTNTYRLSNTRHPFTSHGPSSHHSPAAWEKGPSLALVSP
jgi:hypothetical protein